MTWRLHKAKNGWLVTSKGTVFTDDIAECHVFESMRSAAAYLVRCAGEDRRDKTGRFMKSMSAKE